MFYLLPQLKITLNIYIFMFLKDIFVVEDPFIFLGVYHYFGHHGRLASQIFKPRLYFNYFNPAIILIKQKLQNWFGMKAAKISDFGYSNFAFGHWNMSKWAYISHTDRQFFWPLSFILKKSIWSGIMGENWVLRFLPLQWALF